MIGVLIWLRRNWKVIAAVGALFFAIGVGWSVRAKLCDLKILKIQRDIALATEAKSKETQQRAKELESERRKLERLRRNLNRKVLSASDTSYGCHVNPDGMQLIDAALGRDRAGES